MSQSGVEFTKMHGLSKDRSDRLLHFGLAIIWAASSIIMLLFIWRHAERKTSVMDLTTLVDPENAHNNALSLGWAGFVFLHIACFLAYLLSNFCNKPVTYCGGMIVCSDSERKVSGYCCPSLILSVSMVFFAFGGCIILNHKWWVDHELKSYMVQQFKTDINSTYFKDKIKTNVDFMHSWNTLHMYMECCGVNNHKDYYNMSKPYLVPISCLDFCGGPVKQMFCPYDPILNERDLSHKVGCYQTFKDWFDCHATILISIFFITLGFETILMFWYCGYCYKRMCWLYRSFYLFCRADK